MLPRAWIWAALGAGLLVPVTFLSVTSHRQMRKEIRNRQRIQAAEIERGFLDRVRSVSRLLERSLEERIGAALGRIGPGREGLFEEPLLAHPFVVGAEGGILFPAPPPDVPPEPSDEIWRRRIEEAAGTEARAPGDPAAIASMQDCLLRSPDKAVARRAALLVGAWHLREERTREALDAYEKGWAQRADRPDPETALLGAMRVVCLARVAPPESAAEASIAFLETVLSADAWEDPLESAFVVRLVSDARPPRAERPPTEAGLWHQWDRLPDRLRLRRILAGWGAQALAEEPAEGLLLAWRATPDGAEALAFLPAGAGKAGTGALLDVERIEAWLAERLQADAGPGVWRLAAAQAPVDPGAKAHEPILSRMPLWRLEASPAPIARSGGSADVEGRAGRIFVLAAPAAALLSFALILWTLTRERELARLKGEFISAASHQLRTPLALIRTAGETLRMGRVSDPDRVKGYLGVIDRESRRLGRLMTNLLDFTRLEAGRRAWTPRRLDTSPFLREAVGELQEAFADPGIAWEASIPDSLPAVSADPEALRLILANLVENAVKYSPDGEKRVIVRAAAEGGRIRLEVEDRGPGIPSAERIRVFERFYRSEDARRRGIPGSGIGLALVRQAVEAQGGDIEVLQASPQGTCFRILLPMDGPA